MSGGTEGHKPTSSCEPVEEQKKWSLLFRHPDSDVTFRSKDNLFFALHRKNIDTSALGFPPSEFKSSIDEIVHLDEDGQTLELLFQFMYPSPELPNLDQLPFHVIDKLAEAAEKYGVTVLVYICRRLMRSFIPDHIEGILKYACKHYYPEIIQDIIPHMLRKPLSEIAEIASYGYFTAWTKYIEQWKNIPMILAHDIMNKTYCHGQMGKQLMFILARLGDLDDLVAIDTVFDLGAHEVCCEFLPRATGEWKGLVKTEIWKFATFTDLLTT